MSVTYAVVLKDGAQGLREQAGCFGGLQDTEDFIQWEIDGWNAKSNPVSHVDFYLDEVDKEFCEYLASLPFVQAGLIEMKLDGAHTKKYNYQGMISVCASVNPHHLINIMSMFRTPWSFPETIKTWKYLRSLGIRDDVAHVMSFYLRGESAENLRKQRTTDSEHSYFSICDTKANFAALVEFLSKSEPGAARKKEGKPFSEIMEYNRDEWPKGVVGQSIAYNSRAENGAPLELNLTKSRRYVDIDEEKALEIRARYAELPDNTANQEAMYEELRTAIITSGEEQVNLEPSELQAALVKFAEEFY